MIRSGPKKIEFRAKSGQFAVRGLLKQTSDTFQTWQISPDLRDMFQIVLAETLNNVVEHAYHFEDGHPITLTLLRDCNAVTCLVQDQGCAMPGKVLPMGSEPDLDVAQADLPEGGFGWFLIFSMAESVLYESNDTTNTLTIRLSVV